MRQLPGQERGRSVRFGPMLFGHRDDPTGSLAAALALIVDTGPIFAAMDLSDPDHMACRNLLRDADEQLIVTVPVLVEVEWLSSRRLGQAAFDQVLASVADGGLVVHDLDASAWNRVLELRRRYADMDLGLVDASVIAVAEQLGENKIATLDQPHFRAVRPAHVPALRLLPGD